MLRIQSQLCLQIDMLVPPDLLHLAEYITLKQKKMKKYILETFYVLFHVNTFCAKNIADMF